MLKKNFEEKFLSMVLFDVRKIFNCEENTITENYYDAWVYINEVIDSIVDNASDWLLTELYCLRAKYQYKYLYNKGLI